MTDNQQLTIEQAIRTLSTKGSEAWAHVQAFDQLMKVNKSEVLKRLRSMPKAQRNQPTTVLGFEALYSAEDNGVNFYYHFES